MNTYLEIDSVVKSYDGRTILSDIYLKCVPGNIIGLFGRNGSGKSTLFNILYGTCKAERSFIRINDKVIHGKAYKTGMIGYLPQEDFLPKDMRVKDIIRLACLEANNLMTDEIVQRVFDNRADELSGGEIRYIELLILLNGKAPFIILDEPFNGLAPVTVEKLCTLITESSKTKSILLTDHNYRAVIEVADTYMLLHEGFLRPIKELDELKGIYFI